MKRYLTRQSLFKVQPNLTCLYLTTHSISNTSSRSLKQVMACLSLTLEVLDVWMFRPWCVALLMLLWECVYVCVSVWWGGRGVVQQEVWDCAETRGKCQKRRQSGHPGWQQGAVCFWYSSYPFSLTLSLLYTPLLSSPLCFPPPLYRLLPHL